MEGWFARMAELASTTRAAAESRAIRRFGSGDTAEDRGGSKRHGFRGRFRTAGREAEHTGEARKLFEFHDTARRPQKKATCAVGRQRATQKAQNDWVPEQPTTAPAPQDWVSGSVIPAASVVSFRATARVKKRCGCLQPSAVAFHRKRWHIPSVHWRGQPPKTGGRQQPQPPFCAKESRTCRTSKEPRRTKT